MALEMISYTNGNNDLIKFDYYPKDWIRRHLRSGKITRHPKLKTVYQFWFKQPKIEDVPDEYTISNTYMNGEQVKIKI